MSASILATSTYTYPIPLWADGTPLFVGPTTPHAIDEISRKYADRFGASGDPASGDKGATYYAQLKAALGVLKEILDGCVDIDTSSAEKLRTTFEKLKSDKFYTNAQSLKIKEAEGDIPAQYARIDGNCREGFLAYRHYLKTIVSALDRVYGYLEDGRQALEALEDETDSDVAHTLITQLEIDEQFIYDEFQALRTHYKYNADTKQWDKVVDDDFKTQLEEIYYGHDKNGCLIDADGHKIAKNTTDNRYYILNSEGNLTDTQGEPVVIGTDIAPSINPKGVADGKYYVVSDDGKSLVGDEVTPAVVYRTDLFSAGGDVPCFFRVHEISGKLYGKLVTSENTEESQWYELDSNVRPIKKVNAPTGMLPTPYADYFDEDGDKVKQNENDNKWYKLDSEGNFTPKEATPIYQRDEDGFLLDTSSPNPKRIMKADGSWYQLDDQGKLTMVRSFSYADLQALRDTKIAYKDSTSETGERKDKPLTVFNSITLLDRLLYIRYYYELILKLGAADYSVFPNSSETGYPCLPDVKSTVATQDTKNLGALEVFYVGYLIDRDGPINAVSSFFEVKTAALRNNLSLQSQKITALNMYLDFINRGMDVLNQSQSNGKKRIPDGTVIAVTYFCGLDMYNLFEAPNGQKYLVLPVVDTNGNLTGDYNLIRADDMGKLFLFGDDGLANDSRGNGSCANSSLPDGDDKGKLHAWCISSDMSAADKIDMTGATFEPNKEYSGTTSYGLYATGKGSNGAYKYYKPFKEQLATEGKFTFKLPTQLEVNTILPSSVVDYKSYIAQSDDQKHTAMIESWTNALSNKTQYINTAIDTINTDVSVDRSKIDTFDSLTSTFRSRAQDVYLNTTANIRG